MFFFLQILLKYNWFIVIYSGVQLSDSVIHILFHMLFIDLSQDIKYSSLCYTVELAKLILLCYALLNLKNFIFFFWPCCAACESLVPWSGIEPGPLAGKMLSPNQLDHQEVPEIHLLKFLFIDLIYLAAVGLSCGMWTLICSMWDQVPWPGIEPRPTALGAQSLSHWSSLNFFFFK